METSSEKYKTCLETRSPKKEKVQRGKRMWESRSKTKDLEKKLKDVENRIKHLQFEQDKCFRSSKFMEKKTNEINEIRDKHEKFQQEKVEWKLALDQETDHKRHSLKKYRKQQQENIQEARKRIESKNRINSLCLKAQRRANDAFLRKIKESQEQTLRLQACSVMKMEKSNKHKRSISSQQFLTEKESQYSDKYLKELEKQDFLKRKIEVLSKVEEDISQKLTAQDQKRCQSTCLLFSEKSYSQDKEPNITSIV